MPRCRDFQRVKFVVLHIKCNDLSWKSSFYSKFLSYVWVCREMKKKKGGNDGGKRTKWLLLDVETRRRRGQIICKRWDGLSLALKKAYIYASSTRHAALPPLSQESERLEMLNSDLKAQIEELKLERQQLVLMLNRHRPTCIVRTDSVKTPESEGNPLLEQLEAKWRCVVILSNGGGGRDGRRAALSLTTGGSSGGVHRTQTRNRLVSVQSDWSCFAPAMYGNQHFCKNMKLNPSTGYSTFY